MEQSGHIWVKRAAVTVAAILVSVVLFVAFCLFTPPGHGFLAVLIEPLSGGRVAITDLSGALPNALTARKVEVRDAKGTWLVIEDVRLDWDAFSAFGDHINITRVTAAQLTMLRSQVPRKSTSTSTTSIDIGDLGIARIELKPAVLGHAAVLTANGSLHYTSRHDVAAELIVQRLDASGRYDIHAAITQDILQGTISISESGTGLVGGAIGLPDLGSVALEVRATAQGSRNTVELKFAADHMDVSGTGTMDIAAQTVDLDVAVDAAKMQPSKDLSWSAITAKGHISGSFAAPTIDAHLRIGDLAADGIRMGSLSGTLKGSGGKAQLNVVANGLLLPGETVGVFAAAPVALTADIALNTQSRDVAFALDHSLLHLAGRSTTRNAIHGEVTASLPSLQRLEPLTGVKTDGSAALTLAFKPTLTEMELTAKGVLAASGATIIAKLLGKAALEGTARLGANGALAFRSELKGAAINAEVSGSQRNGRRDITGDVGISDLSRLTPTITGTLALRGSLIGPTDNATLTVKGTASAATKGMAKQAVTIAAEATGLPKLKSANLRLSGRFDNAPVKLNTDINAAGADAWKIAIAEASWRSARLLGSVTIAGQAPRGSLRLAVANLADIAPLLGTPLTGSLDAATEFQGGTANVRLTGANIVSGTTTLGRVELTGAVRDPLGSPALALVLNIPQLATSGVSGSASVRLNGPLNAITTNLTTALTAADGHGFKVAADALVDTTAKHVMVTRLLGNWREQLITLAAPATLDYANGLAFAASFVDGKSADLTVMGTIPSAPGRSMSVHVSGKADLAVITSELASAGQIVRGLLAVNLTATGTLAKPIVTGRVTLTKAQLQDYPRGLNLTEVEAEAEAQGSTLRFTKFSAKAGPGTITGSGTIDLGGAGVPVDMNFKASNARAVTSDLITANVDSDLTLSGRLADRLLLKGQISVDRSTINIPEKFPRAIATLNIRRSKAAAAAPPPSSSSVALDLTVVSDGQIFVRGRGLEAEFEGDLKIGGTTASPQVEGALTLRRGTLSLAGANLTFQYGEISFNGQALRHRLDPTLDMVAQSEANGITATLKISGSASQPRVALSSSPPLPQDEILSQLLFQQSAKSLSPLQLASVAQAAASLGGSGSFDPVGIMRSSLGLDRLAVGSSQAANGGSGSTTIEAGKYVFRNVYVGARQELGGGTRALVQVDITKHIKAQAQVNSGPRAATTTSTPLQDNGDSIGLSYQFEY